MAKGTVTSTKKNAKKTTKSPLHLHHHPPYFEMISEAILSLKERTGSSQPAIAKLIEEKYQSILPSNFKKQLSVQLKKFVKSERLVKIKNSYKISSIEKLKLDIKNTLTLTQKPKADHSNNKSQEKSGKTKRLSQVKTPEVLKKAKKDGKSEKMKRLSQVKTPDRLRKKQNSSKARR